MFALTLCFSEKHPDADSLYVLSLNKTLILALTTAQVSREDRCRGGGATPGVHALLLHDFGALLLQPLTWPPQVLSGLAGKIPLESMAGRRVVVICNLKPAKMRGLFSYAMIFAASSA